MFKNLKTKLFYFFGAAVYLLLLSAPMAQAAQPRDYNSNSVIYGGAYSVQELKGLLQTGVNRDNCIKNYTCPYQRSNDLNELYNKLGMGPANWDHLVDGTVFKDGHVEVNGKKVASNVYSMGRHDMPGSTRDYSISFPVYWRHPNVSFRSNSIPAFVYMNYDGTMAFAIIKSCGNPVKGVGVREERFRGFALKWIDENGNGVWDKSENTRQAGVTFTLTGNGENKTAVTDSMGYAPFYNLKKGTYTVTEKVPAGYKNTTGVTKTLVVDHDRAVATFGNQKIVTYSLTVKKWNDADGDKVIDKGENYLPNWTFKIQGNGIDKPVTTDKNGEATLSGLTAGKYTVTETQKEGWTSTTGLTQEVTLNCNKIIFFGNRTIPVTPKTNFSIVVKKYEDLNGNGKHDENEAWLAGWDMKLTGAKAGEQVTDKDGSTTFASLPAGTYTVTEEMQTGWKNITPISQTVTLPDKDNIDGYVEFGNQRVSTPVKPQGEITTTPLPSAGPEEAFAGIFGTVSLAGAGAYYFKGKKLLKSAFRKIK